MAFPKSGVDAPITKDTKPGDVLYEDDDERHVYVSPTETRIEWKGAYATAQTNQTSLQAKAAAALKANQTFLAIQSPTAAQVAAQTARLTRQQNALIRLALGDFTADDA